MDGRLSEALAAVVDIVADGRPLAAALADIADLVRRTLVADGVLIAVRSAGTDVRASSGRDGAPCVVAPFRADDIDGMIALVAEAQRARVLEADVKPLALVTGLALAARGLRERASTDLLTGVGSRRTFDETLDTEFARATREGTTLGVLLIDVDFFDIYCDRCGALAGDDTLARVAAAAVSTLKRAGDHFARYAGERFAAVLPRTPLAGAIYAAERMREAIAALALPAPLGADGQVSISIGVAVRAPQRDDAAAAMLATAEANLYRARGAGHNRVAADGYLSAFDVHPLDPLAAPLTRFFGRDAEIATIADALGVSSVVSLTGAAGIGKTRVALEAAQRAARGFGSVHYLHIRDDDGPAILAKIGAAFDIGGAPTLAAIGAATRGPTLLVIDDLESVRGDGSSTLAEVAGLPNVSLLGAGRFPLGVPAERRIEITALDEVSARTLFLERARRGGVVLDARSDAALATLLGQLGGVPLAIELAAASLASDDVAALSSRLRERGARGDAASRRAMVVTLAEGLAAPLTGDEARAFAALSLFRAPITPSALATVLGIGEGAALAACRALVHRALLAAAAYDGVIRYALLDPVREVADLALRARRDAGALAAAYVARCTAVVEAAPERGPLRSASRAAVVDASVDDIRAALHRAAGDPALGAAGAELLGSVARPLIVRGRITEATALLERFIAEPHVTTRAGARLNTALASIALARGDFATLRSRAQRAHDLLVAGDERASPDMANVLNYVGVAARVHGAFDEAREAWLALRALSLQLGNRRGEAIAELALGSLALDVDLEADRADDAFTRAAIAFAELGDARNLFLCRYGHVACAAERGDGAALDAARELGFAAAALGDPSFVVLAGLITATAAGAAGDRATMRDALTAVAPLIRDLRQAEYAFDLAEAAARVVVGDDPALAAYVLGTADRRAAEHALPRLPLVARRRETVVARARAGLGAAAFEAQRARGFAADPDTATDELVALLTPARA